MINPIIGMKVIFNAPNNPIFHAKVGTIIEAPPDYLHVPNGHHGFWWVEFDQKILGRYQYRCDLKELSDLNDSIFDHVKRQQHAMKLL